MATSPRYTRTCSYYILLSPIQPAKLGLIGFLLPAQAPCFCMLGSYVPSGFGEGMFSLVFPGAADCRKVRNGYP